jgi:hypothetical protein
MRKIRYIVHLLLPSIAFHVAIVLILFVAAIILFMP